MNLSTKVSVVAWLHKYYLLNYAKYIIYMKIIVFHSHFWHPSLDDKACLDWVSKNQTQGDRDSFVNQSENVLKQNRCNSCLLLMPTRKFSWSPRGR